MTLAIASDLMATLEREEFREALERLCVSEWHSGALQETRIRPIRTRPNRCTVVIDLDEHDTADPSRDVAAFLVALQRRAIKLLAARHALDSAADAFVEAYTTSGLPGAQANLRPYRALACLRRARRDLHKQNPELAEFIVDEALRVMSH